MLDALIVARVFLSPFGGPHASDRFREVPNVSEDVRLLSEDTGYRDSGSGEQSRPLEIADP